VGAAKAFAARANAAERVVERMIEAVNLAKVELNGEEIAGGGGDGQSR